MEESNMPQQLNECLTNLAMDMAVYSLEVGYKEWSIARLHEYLRL